MGLIDFIDLDGCLRVTDDCYVVMSWDGCLRVTDDDEWV